MENRLTTFIIFIALSVITLGFYPVFFYITRMQEQVDILRDISAKLEDGK